MLVEVGYDGLQGEGGLEAPPLPLLSQPHCQELSLALERGPEGHEGLSTSWTPGLPFLPQASGPKSIKSSHHGNQDRANYCQVAS